MLHKGSFALERFTRRSGDDGAFSFYLRNETSSNTKISKVLQNTPLLLMRLYHGWSIKSNYIFFMEDELVLTLVA